MAINLGRLAEYRKESNSLYIDQIRNQNIMNAKLMILGLAFCALCGQGDLMAQKKVAGDRKSVE